MGDTQSQLGGPDGLPTGLLEANAAKVLHAGNQRDLKDFGAGGASEPQLETTLLTQLLNLLAHRPRHSLLLSDLGALLPGNLRQGVKEKGGLRSWLQKYPEIFQVSGQPGKESVTLLVLGGAHEAGPAPVGPQQGLSAAELDAAKKREEEDNESAVQLRGLPYRATMQDVKYFLKHHVKNLKDDPNAVQLVLNRDGRPSGFGRVQFKSPEAARQCRDELHMRVMEVAGEHKERERGERYVEIFLYAERPNKLRFKKALGDTEGQEEEIEALGITKQHVLDECRRHMSQEGKSQLLLSMLGVALSPGSRLYLKKTDQGLKHFLSSCPTEFSVDGSKGREVITYLPATGEEQNKSFFEGAFPEIAAEEMKEERLPCLALPKAPPKSLPLPSPASPTACAAVKAVSPMPPGSGSCGHLGTRRGCESAGPISGNISDLGGFPPTPQIDDMVPESPKASLPSHLEELGGMFQTPSDWGTPLDARHRPLVGPLADNFATNFAAMTSTAVAGASESMCAHLPASHPSQPWSAWGMPPAAPFWPPMMMPPGEPQGLRGQGMAANGEGLQMMLTSFFAMNGGPGSWQQPPWIPEAPQPEQEQGGDIIQKLINKEIPMPQALSAAQVEKPQVLDASQAPAAVRLRGLPYDANEQDILAWMARYDVVDRVLECKQAVRIYNKTNGKPMGVAVVALNSLEAADEVLEALNGQYIKNRYIEVFHHTEGEAGTDKACVQGLGGGTGSCSASHAKTAELPYETSPFFGLGDTGGSGGAAVGAFSAWSDLPFNAPSVSTGEERC